jgi:hypothetical protein
VPAGESVQRQPCGRAGTAPPTRGQENATLAAVCARRRPCDDPRVVDIVKPRMRVLGTKVQDVDRFALRFVLNEDGDVTTRGAAVVQNPRRSRFFASTRWGPIQRHVRANVPVRIKQPLSAAFRRAVKRGARRGFRTSVTITTVGRDYACPQNRFHSSRSYELVP